MTDSGPSARRSDIDLSQHDLSSESVVHSLVRSSPDNIMLIDLEHRLLFINWTVPQFKVSEVLGRRVFDFVSESHRPPMRECFAQVLETAQPGRYETMLVTDDGTTSYWESSVGPVMRDEKVVAFAVTSRDVTERRALEQRLLQAQKMEAVGQLAGGIAHDFNNLLLVMQANAELARGAAPDKVDQFLEQIEQSTARAADLTRKLLTFSRRQVMQMKPTDLNAVVTETLSMVRRLMPGDIELTFAPDETLEHVHADATHLEQIIVNLCLNARDAMPSGGRLEIRTSTVVDGHKIRRAGATAARGHVHLSVSDTGHGIDPKVKPRIFEPFFTTKEPGRGTGLGLATTYAIVVQHSGVLDVDSTPGVGTIFHVYLPLNDTPLRAEHAVRTPAVREAGHGETILIAEDEPMVRETVTTILEDAGYDVIVAEDGQQAVERFERNADRVALVLLDVVMPKFGGPAAWKRIQTMSATTTVLFTSGYADPEIEPPVADEQIISKPYLSEELLRRIRSTLDRRAQGLPAAQRPAG